MAGSTQRPEQLLAAVRTARAQQGVLDDGGRRVGPPGCGPDARPWCWGQRKRIGSTSPSLWSSTAKSSTGRPWIMWSCQKQKEPVPPPRLWWNRAADASPGQALLHRKPSSTRRCWTVSGVAARDWRTQDSARTLPCKCPWGCSMLPGIKEMVRNGIESTGWSPCRRHPAEGILRSLPFHHRPGPRLDGRHGAHSSHRMDQRPFPRPGLELVAPFRLIVRDSTS
ncbi:hypothetical protein QFZ40_000230 [Arthrobacter pascens]|nr:hypothetical protein [Arthrobacter pascens]